MFLPLHDHNPLLHVTRPYVTWSLILANCAAFLLLQGAGLGETAQASAYSYGLIPSVLFDIKDLAPDLAVVPGNATLVTYAFLHADVWHLAGNMLFLWVFGDNVEDALGHLRYLLFYLACAVAGGFAYAALDPNSDVPLIGASAAGAGIVAAYLILHPRVRVWVLVLGRVPLPIPALWALGAWIAFQVFNVLFVQDSQVAWSAHVGGIAAGAVLVVFLRRRGVPLFDRGLQV
ncbi:rhomboid family intramembrane serine protease [Polymorphum gilvum]|uniref:Peptidase, S54 (Rhomboid) family, putative n=1 Tax=Polymorphum gilvum (strain LMG 25793 / CGMCC 1.9160 / SL003B-26A1) TaxID=991905 RepID=F2IZD1_POLGS|nr:rhomboid family intramembrane serine protease [Polymorphum gilvum]ADZ68554.1 Peptidase, S54 (Rhomboid) family, putative [Polymorphum gilvum SL003B-26A1]